MLHLLWLLLPTLRMVSLLSLVWENYFRIGVDKVLRMAVVDRDSDEHYVVMGFYTN